MCLLCSQQVWHLNSFMVAKITRTCDATCSETSSANLNSATANSNTIVTCVTAPNQATDLKGKSALQCHRCLSGATDAACKNAQTSSSPKIGGISATAAAACTKCYVSELWLQQ